MGHKRRVITPAQITLQDEAVFSADCADVYHSREGAFAQAQTVFLDGCGLPARWRRPPSELRCALADPASFMMVELGFGFGINFLATAEAWLNAAQEGGVWYQTLHYLAVDAHPPRVDDLKRVHQCLLQQHRSRAATPNAGAEPSRLEALSEQLIERWPSASPGRHRLRLKHSGCSIILDLDWGWADQQIKQWRLGWDCAYLDGFAPSKSADLWQPTVLKRLLSKALPDATLATWCVAGEVRRQIASSGFEVQRLKGFGGKRHRLVGSLRGDRQVDPRRLRVSRTGPQVGCDNNGRPSVPGPRLLVFGAGLAGSAIAYRMAQRGWAVDVADAAEAPASGGSGNPLGSFHPQASKDDSILSRLTRAGSEGLINALRELAEQPDASLGSDGSDPWFCLDGHLQLADSERRARDFEAIAGMGWYGEGGLQWWDCDRAAQVIGFKPPYGGLWFRQAGRVSPGALCRRWLAHPGIRLITRLRLLAVEQLRFDQAACDHRGEPIAVDPSRVGSQDDRSPVEGATASLKAAGCQWTFEAKGAERLADAYDAIVVATAFAPAGLQLAGSPTPVRGQITKVEPSLWPELRLGLSGAVYALPALNPASERASHVIGATHHPGVSDDSPRAEDDMSNFRKLTEMLPELSQRLAPAQAAISSSIGRAALRAATLDRLPMIGALPALAEPREGAQRLLEVDRVPGVFVALGFGGRGLCWSSIAADVIESQILGLPLPLDADLIDAIDPARFSLRGAEKKPRS